MACSPDCLRGPERSGAWLGGGGGWDCSSTGQRESWGDLRLPHRHRDSSRAKEALLPQHFLTQPLVTPTTPGAAASAPLSLCLSVFLTLHLWLNAISSCPDSARGVAFGVRLLSRRSFLPPTLWGPRETILCTPRVGSILLTGVRAPGPGLWPPHHGDRGSPSTGMAP